MTTVIDNARKILEWFDDDSEEGAGIVIGGMAVAAALRDVLDSLEYEYAIHSAKGEHLYPVDEQDRPMTAHTLWEVAEALGDRDPDYWDADDVIVKRFFGEWEKVS